MNTKYGRFALRSRSWRRAVLGFMAVGVCLSGGLFCGLACPQLRAADKSNTAAIQACIEAGEFAPAVRLAQQLPTPELRDGWLARIADRQAKIGAGSQAIATAGAMRSDIARNKALQDLKPFQGARGGNQQADFNSLINLVTDTIAPTTWDEVGGPGSVAPFRTGVYVDSTGALKRAIAPPTTENDDLAMVRRAAQKASGNRNAHHGSTLRKISLSRLERAVQMLAAEGKRPTEEMQFLAGLERIKYVLVYPETGDIVLAGPADHWRVGDENRVVAETSGRPVVRLDDFVVVLRCLMSKPNAIFGCSITPLEENMKQTQAFLTESAKAPLPSGDSKREAWLSRVREKLGQQRIDVDGVDPRTRAGQVLVEADYHMKLVGMGLEPGVPGVVSYLNSIQVPPGQAPPPLDVLRWWFTMNYDAVRTTEHRDAFEIKGVGVQVLGENEKLAQGKRIHTGQAAELNQTFTQSFTDHFDLLAQKYPVYAELQNIFDLALAVAIVKSNNLPDMVDWHMTCFSDSAQYQPPLSPAPRMVDSVINHRMVNRKYILAGVSGGVQVDPWKSAKPDATRADKTGKLKIDRSSSTPGNRPADSWWWD